MRRLLRRYAFLFDIFKQRRTFLASLQAKRSNLEMLREDRPDCFGADAPRNDERLFDISNSRSYWSSLGCCLDDPVFQRRQCLIETPLEYWMPKAEHDSGEDTGQRSRGWNARALHRSCPSKIRGRREGRVAGRTHGPPATKKLAAVTTGQPINRPSLRNGFTAYT
jgi:hypothetical protein